MKIVNENTMSKDFATAIGISDILIDTLNKKYDAIRDLNSIKVTMDANDCEEMIPVINSMIEDENNHLGKLQHLIDTLNPAAEEIEIGKQEAIKELDEGLKRRKLREGSGKYFLSHYEEYPIYEPAEGGYYYAGRQLVSHEDFDTLEEAKASLDEWVPELLAYGFEEIDDNFYFKRSRYIGEDELVLIETELGSEECGPHPFE